MYLEECVQEAEAFLDAAYAAQPARGELIVNGQQFSPSTRALPGADVIWRLSDEEAWELFESRIDDKIDECGFVWDDGRLLA
jgi:hypothetical protein